MGCKYLTHEPDRGNARVGKVESIILSAPDLLGVLFALP